MGNNIRLAAEAYYNNSSNPELKQLAWEFFQSIDTDRDGRVVDSNFFSQLDVNRDGSLDFVEFLTFYYVLKTRNVWCADCRVNLSGLYFTCVECFDGGLDTFDVCAPCYSANRFCHHHGRDQFLDSFVLLLSRRGVSHVKHSNMVS
ncbi:hypothetical protein FEM48_Zijuj07G0088400 [Ziziphus jujuba var. spinosa]|uniref:EF-hand domain-containing protein n=1 Tax=Ziziphus jujuba var. spinosa TaxID=714518 RepID=A0A978V3N7_ZIZJJ|nr:hypothetical protein FEM48_Zijuj07G0088400 [Ziziphus jujuba var. spinosa]